MEEYWKLLDLDNDEYSTHETEEEVNHIIDYLTRDMDEDKEVTRKDIETPFNNYNFQKIIVVDSYKVRRFLYFFDTIEEQCDSFEEEITELRTHRESNQLDALREQVSRRNNKVVELMEQNKDAFKRLNEKTDYIMKLEAKIRELQKRFDSLVKEDTFRILSLEQELQELQTQRDNLVNKNAELEGKLIRYAGKIDELESHNSTLKEAHEHISKLYHRSQDELFTARRSRDFWHKKFLDIASPNDFPF